jgi:hypothetical protein
MERCRQRSGGRRRVSSNALPTRLISRSDRNGAAAARAAAQRAGTPRRAQLRRASLRVVHRRQPPATAIARTAASGTCRALPGVATRCRGAVRRVCARRRLAEGADCAAERRHVSLVLRCVHAQCRRRRSGTLLGVDCRAAARRFAAADRRRATSAMLRQTLNYRKQTRFAKQQQQHQQSFSFVFVFVFNNEERKKNTHHHCFANFACTIGFSGAFCHSSHSIFFTCCNRSDGFSFLIVGSRASSYALNAAFMRRSGCASIAVDVADDDDDDAPVLPIDNCFKAASTSEASTATSYR